MWLKAREVFFIIVISIRRPRVRGGRRREDTSSRQRETQSLAAARHVDGSKAGHGEAPGAAIALLIDLELAFARAQLGGAAPVQWRVLDLEGAIRGVDRLGERENLLRCARDIRIEAFARVDAIPAAADPGPGVRGG